MTTTNTPKVTVIVPVYNVEKYLERCISSIINQTYTNLEIILVDDGSRDNSGLMCDQWGQRDSRILVVHKENGGLGFARNTGLENMSGDYVSFIDSDDYIELDTYSKLVRRMEDSGADVCYFGCNYDDQGKITYGEQRFPEEIYSQEKIKSELLPYSFGTSIKKEADPYGVGSVCCAIYRSSIFNKNGLRFGSERQVLSEDILFTSYLLTKVTNATFDNGNYYYYCYNGASLSHTYRPDRFEKAKLFYALQLQLIDNNKLSTLCKERAKYSFLINVIVCLKQEMAKESFDMHETLNAISEISNDELYREIYKSLNAREFNLKKRLLFYFLYSGHVRIVLLLISKHK